VLVGITESSKGIAGSMKKVGKLWDEVCSMENIELAHKRAKKGKKHYSEVIMVDSDKKKYLTKVQEMLVRKTFVNAAYKEMSRFDSGKHRVIKKLPYYPDRIVQHCVANVCAKVWDKTMIRDTYAAIPGRGVHDGVRRVKRALDIDQEGTTYCLKLDVKKYYDSVDNEILKTIVREKIKDADVLWLLDLVIDSAIGIPIGNYLSQYFGNLYLSGVDHYAKEVLGCRYYFRYCDDIVVLSGDKQSLHRVREALAIKMKPLSLEVKPNWQVFPVDVRGIDFLGYRFFHGFMLVRKRIVKRFKQKFCQGNMKSMAAYHGWLSHANTYNLRGKYAYRL
jgi:RNA-directed DNA polymerase